MSDGSDPALRQHRCVCQASRCTKACWNNNLVFREFADGNVGVLELKQACVGRYQLMSPMDEMVITIEGGQLFAQYGKHPKLEISPEREHRYFWKVVNAQNTFETNSNVMSLPLYIIGTDAPYRPVPHSLHGATCRRPSRIRRKRSSEPSARTRAIV